MCINSNVNNYLYVNHYIQALNVNHGNLIPGTDYGDMINMYAIGSILFVRGSLVIKPSGIKKLEHKRYEFNGSGEYNDSYIIAYGEISKYNPLQPIDSMVGKEEWIYGDILNTNYNNIIQWGEVMSCRLVIKNEKYTIEIGCTKKLNDNDTHMFHINSYSIFSSIINQQ